MDRRQKEKAVKKMFTKLQNDHKEINGQKARGKLAVAEIKGTDWLHKKVTELREVKTSTKTGRRQKETSTKTKIAVRIYYCYIIDYYQQLYIIS